MGFLFARQEQGVWQQQPMIREPWSSKAASPPPDPAVAGGAEDVEQPHARRITPMIVTILMFSPSLSRLHLLGGRRVDDGPDLEDFVRREAACLGVLPHRRLVGGDVDAEHLVVRHVTVLLMDAAFHPAEHVAGLL